MNEDNKRLPLYLLLFGIVIAVIGAFLFGRYVFAKTNGEKAHAIISDIVETEDSDGDTSYDVYVTYYIGDRQITAHMDTYVAGMRVGARVDVYYLPGKETEVLYSKAPIGAFIAFISGIGIVALSFVLRRKNTSEIAENDNNTL